jgi:hypothetical protein
MTTGTVLAFIFTGSIVPVAIVSGIWLEARLPAPQPPHTGPSGHRRPPGPMGLQAGGDRAGTTDNGPRGLAVPAGLQRGQGRGASLSNPIIRVRWSH